MRTRVPTSRAVFRIRISIFDFLCAIAAPFMALYFGGALILKSQDVLTVLLYCALSTVFSIIAFSLFRVHDAISRYFSVHDALDILKAAAFSQLLTIVAFFTFIRLEGIPRSTPIYQALILVVGLFTVRAITQALQNGDIATNGHDHAAAENIIMIGATHLSSLYIKLLEAVSPSQHRIIALLDDRPQLVGRSIAGIQIVASPQQLRAIVNEFDVHGIHANRVIIGEETNKLTSEELKEIRDVCDQNEIRLDFVRELIGLGELPQAVVKEEPAPKPILAPNFKLPRYFRFRPIFDFLAAMAITVLLSPILIIAAALVLLDVGSPVLFWQQRIGQGGHRFLLYKFRTMRAPYDWRGHPISDRNVLTFTGRLLRQTRLDELPQLLNVLVGNMALIGPRPLLPEDQPHNPATRLMVRPGITGWAQVNGGKFLTPQQKDQYDEFYVRNASPWFDLRILLMTVRVLFRFTLHSDHEVAADSRVGYGKTDDALSAIEAADAIPRSARAQTRNHEVESPPIVGVAASTTTPFAVNQISDYKAKRAGR
jgi:lipopolysaccharide/colanic/teichoic acid biosynthesis glycosyltransferase